MAKLTETKLRGARPGKHFDANGLYALVPKQAGSIWWRIRLLDGRREQHLSLGTWPETSLDDARIRAATVRAARKRSDDVALLAAKLRGASAPHQSTVVKSEPTDALEAVVKRWNKWRAENERERAPATMVRNDNCVRYLVNALGPITSMATIDVQALQQAIIHIKSVHKREMAKRTLQLANQLWQYAMHERIVPHNPRSGINTKFVLGEQQKGEFSAITEPKPFGALLRTINAYTGYPVTRIALQLLALTFVRPGELRTARWSEFDLDSDVPQWVIPIARMKMRSDKERGDHIVPLSKQAVALLRDLHMLRDAEGELVCPGLRKGKPISDAVFTTALRQMGVGAAAHHAHGFRKSATSMLHGLGFNAELVETQLGHKRPGIRGIYFKAHLLAERRPMMQRWADYLDELTRMTAHDNGTSSPPIIVP
jgi:integrase